MTLVTRRPRRRGGPDDAGGSPGAGQAARGAADVAATGRGSRPSRPGHRRRDGLHGPDAVEQRREHLAHGEAPGRLAEASYALCQSERHGSSRLDWQAILLSGHHAVRGAEVLRRSCAGPPLRDAGALTDAASDVARRFDRLSDGLLRRDVAATTRPVPDPSTPPWPTGLGVDVYRLGDATGWLGGLREDLSHAVEAGEPATDAPTDPRVAVGRLADGATG